MDTICINYDVDGSFREECALCVYSLKYAETI